MAVSASTDSNGLTRISSSLSSEGSISATSPGSCGEAKSSLPSAENDQLNRLTQLSPNYADCYDQDKTPVPPGYNGQDLEPSAALFSASAPGSTNGKYGKG